MLDVLWPNLHGFSHSLCSMNIYVLYSATVPSVVHTTCNFMLRLSLNILHCDRLAWSMDGKSGRDETTAYLYAILLPSLLITAIVGFLQATAISPHNSCSLSSPNGNHQLEFCWHKYVLHSLISGPNPEEHPPIFNACKWGGHKSELAIWLRPSP